jgi:diacylglycerol kinase family enzyme
MIIFLNPSCDYGKGRKKWQKVEPELRRRFGEFTVEEILSPDRLAGQVEDAIAVGENFFIAAGGDGTVNLLLNALMNALRCKPEAVMGAVGLGSSNDFHKPFRPETFVEGIPARLNRDSAKPCDIIRVRFHLALNQFVTRYCIINASIGITAQANAIYNSRLPFIKRIQKFSIEGAIIASALKTIFTFHNIPCQIALQGAAPLSCRLTNLGVIKNPYFAGGLCYDTPVKPDDGRLGVNLCAGMTIIESIKTLARLYKRQFRGRLKTYSWSTTGLSVSSEQPFALEMDGEVVPAKRAEFELLPKRVRCCS